MTDIDSSNGPGVTRALADITALAEQAGVGLRYIGNGGRAFGMDGSVVFEFISRDGWGTHTRLEQVIWLGPEEFACGWGRYDPPFLGAGLLGWPNRSRIFVPHHDLPDLVSCLRRYVAGERFEPGPGLTTLFARRVLTALRLRARRAARHTSGDQR